MKRGSAIRARIVWRIKTEKAKSRATAQSAGKLGHIWGACAKNPCQAGAGLPSLIGSQGTRAFSTPHRGRAPAAFTCQRAGLWRANSVRRQVNQHGYHLSSERRE